MARRIAQRENGTHFEHVPKLRALIYTLPTLAISAIYLYLRIPEPTQTDLAVSSLAMVGLILAFRYPLVASVCSLPRFASTGAMMPVMFILLILAWQGRHTWYSWLIGSILLIVAPGWRDLAPALGIDAFAALQSATWLALSTAAQIAAAIGFGLALRAQRRIRRAATVIADLEQQRARTELQLALHRDRIEIARLMHDEVASRLTHIVLGIRSPGGPTDAMERIENSARVALRQLQSTIADLHRLDSPELAIVPD